MTEFTYQVTLAKRDAAVAQALAFLRAGDADMFTFWAKVAHDFERRARGEFVRPSSLKVLRAHARA